MTVPVVMWIAGVLIILAVGDDALKRRLTGTTPVFTQRHLVWVILAQAIIIASLFLLPVLALIDDAT